MFSHIMIGTNDLDRAKSFYDALLGTLGVPPASVDRHRIFYRTTTGTFSVSMPIDGEPATPANGGTIGFRRSTARPTPGTRPASPLAAPPARTRRACARARRQSSTSPICAIRTATSSAPCTGCRRDQQVTAATCGRQNPRLSRRSSGLHASLTRWPLPMRGFALRLAAKLEPVAGFYFGLAEPKLGCHAWSFRLGAAAITLILSFLGFLASRLPFCWPFATCISLGFENSANGMQRRQDQRTRSDKPGQKISLALGRRGASRSYLLLSAAIRSSVQVR